MGIDTASLPDNSQSSDPSKNQQLALKKEKEEFLKSLGIRQNPKMDSL